MAGFKKGGKGDKPKNYAEGGRVAGPGTGTSDDVKAQVPDGSYVMPADSTAQIGPEQLAKMGEGAPVNVNLSNGEQVLPPEQVQAIGVQALDQMKQATHTPAKGFQPQAQASATNPELFFADGGEVRKKTQFGGTFADELAARGIHPRYVPPGGQPPAYAQSTPHYVPPGGPPPAYAQPQPQPAPAPAPTPAPASTPQTAAQPPRNKGFIAPNNPYYLNEHMPGVEPAKADAAPMPKPAGGFTSGLPSDGRMKASLSAFNPAAPQINPNQPPAVAQPTQDAVAPTHDWNAEPYAPGWRLKAVVDGTKDRVGELVDQGEYARTAGAVTRGTLAAIPALAADAGQLAYDNVLEPIGNFGKELLGFQGESGQAKAQPARPASQPTTAPPQSAPAQPPVASKPAATAQQGEPPLPADYAKPAGFTPIPAKGAPKPQQAVMTQNDTGPTVLTGDKYRTGGKDSVTATADQWGDATNVISGSQEAMAQNLRAIQIMQGSNGSPEAAPRTRGFFVAHQGQNGDGAAAKNAALLAASTPYQGSQNRQLTAAQIRALTDISQNDSNNSNALERARIEQEGAYDRAAMQEAGAYDRTNIQEQGQNIRFTQSNELDRQRTNADVQQKGFGIRAGQRLEKLYQQYEAAKPEERAAIAEQIQVLTGKDSPNRYTVVPGGQMWDAEAGTVLTQPSSVINNQTGQFIDQGRPQAQAPVARPVGTRSTVNGKTAVWDGKQWIPQ
ncbi:MAG: hypothetical protein ACRC9H_10070 [Aeromonas veronii]